MLKNITWFSVDHLKKSYKIDKKGRRWGSDLQYVVGNNLESIDNVYKKVLFFIGRQLRR